MDYALLKLALWLIFHVLLTLCAFDFVFLAFFVFDGGKLENPENRWTVAKHNYGAIVPEMCSLAIVGISV
jgi:hypothetical protein